MLAVVMLLPAIGASAVNFKPIASIDEKGKPVELKLYSKACCVMDMESGDTICESNADKQLPIGTMNMLMTSLIIVEKYPDIHTLKNTKASAGSEAYDELFDRGTPTADIQPNEKVSYYDLICAMMLQSSCEAANIAAINIGKNLAGFTKLMNDKAAALGLKDTKFSSAHGFWTSGNYSTARDLAKLSRHIMENSAILKDIVCLSEHKMEKTDYHPDGTTLYNNDVLLNSASPYYYSGVKGLKTSTTNESGRSCCSYAVIDATGYIVVTLGAPLEMLEEDKQKGIEDPTSLYAYDYIYYSLIDHINLFNWCSTYLSESDFLNPESEIRDVEVMFGDKDYANLKAKTGYSRMWPTYVKTSDVKRVITVKENIIAPVEVGDVLGEMKLIYDGETIATLDLVSTTQVKRSTFNSKVEIAKSYFHSKVFFITLGIIAGVFVLYTALHVLLVHRHYLRKNSEDDEYDN
jgi:D-alanyl-D-alanine carboxypeptidase (penicillin-binding protein 5/6)